MNPVEIIAGWLACAAVAYLILRHNLRKLGMPWTVGDRRITIAICATFGPWAIVQVGKRNSTRQKGQDAMGYLDSMKQADRRQIERLSRHPRAITLNLDSLAAGDAKELDRIVDQDLDRHPNAGKAFARFGADVRAGRVIGDEEHRQMDALEAACETDSSN